MLVIPVTVYVTVGFVPKGDFEGDFVGAFTGEADGNRVGDKTGEFEGIFFVICQPRGTKVFGVDINTNEVHLLNGIQQAPTWNRLNQGNNQGKSQGNNQGLPR